MSLWLPRPRTDFNLLEGQRHGPQAPASPGILISPASHGIGDLPDIAAEYGEFTSLVIDGRGIASPTHRRQPAFSLYDQDPKLAAISDNLPLPRRAGRTRHDLLQRETAADASHPTDAAGRNRTTQRQTEPSFEQALAELEELVAAMEEDQLPLEELVEHYEKGSKLLARCEAVLDSARKRLELITLAARNPATPSGARCRRG